MSSEVMSGEVTAVPHDEELTFAAQATLADVDESVSWQAGPLDLEASFDGHDLSRRLGDADGWGRGLIQLR